LNRRSFHLLALSAILSEHSVAQTGSGLYERWKLGVITDQVSFDLRRVLSGFYIKYPLRWAEIRYLRLRGNNRYVYTDASAQELKQVRKELDDAGVRVSVLDTAIYKIALPGTNPVGEKPAYVDPAHESVGQQLEDLKRAADAAHALGTNRVRIFTFRRVADPDAIFDRVLEQLQRSLTVAKQNDIVLLVENEYDTNTATGREIVRLFRAISDRRFMHNWDPCNSYETGEKPYPTVWNQIDHSRISHIHLKDAQGAEWKPIGSGQLDFAGQFRALKSMGYSGTLSLETRYRNAQQDAYRSSVESMNGLIHFLDRVT
jgi:sugar phosphate isomerase/epimerase